MVHGGTRFDTPVRVDANVLTEIEALAPLAPEHQSAEIAVIRSLQELLPHAPLIACFDTLPSDVRSKCRYINMA